MIDTSLMEKSQRLLPVRDTLHANIDPGFVQRCPKQAGASVLVFYMNKGAAVCAVKSLGQFMSRMSKIAKVLVPDTLH